jgi:hypothetical protein
MVLVIDILCPDRNDSPPEPAKARRDEKPQIDRTRLTRLQLINIKGELVDVEN